MFESAKLKIERANKHNRDTEAEFATYVATNPHRFSIYNDPQTKQPIIRIRFVSEPPQILSLIIGDAIHNIRTALDYLMWEVIGIDGGTQNHHLTLRTGKDRVSYEAVCKGIETPSDWVKDLFVSLEIFPGGEGDGLYTLHDFDRANKHKVLTPVVKATTQPTHTIFHPDGSVFVRMKGKIMIHGSGDHINIVNIPPGCYLELDNDAQCTPDIFFGDVDRPSQPVIPTLKQFAQLALGVIQAFEVQFSNRTGC